jgi:cytochrome P450
MLTQFHDSVFRSRAWPLVSLPLFATDPLKFFARTSLSGDIVDLRLPGSTNYLLSHPEDIEHVLIRAHKQTRKDIFLQNASLALGQGLLTSEGEAWRAQRRVAQPFFSRECLPSYASDISAMTESVADGFRNGETRDMHKELAALTLDVVTRSLLGYDGSEDFAALGQAITCVMDYFAKPWPLVVPGFHRIPLPLVRRFHAAVQRLRDFVDRMIDRGASLQKGLLSAWLAERDEAGRPRSREQLRSQVSTMLIAGHETSASALAWTLYLLSKHPDIERRVAAEALALAPGRRFELSDLPGLVEAEQAVNESMRLYPPAWGIGREVIEPFELKGTLFPAKAQLWMIQWSVHRDPRFFRNPELFLPDRWAGDLKSRIPNHAYFPFGGGARACIGASFATTEILLMLATLLRRFRFQLVAGHRVVPLPSLTLRPRFGMPMRIARR